MKILQGHYNYATFKGIRNSTGASNMHESKSDINYFINKSLEVLAQRTENEVPENGMFRPIAVSFKIPDTSNMAKFIVEYDKLNPKDFRRLSVGVVPMGSNEMSSYSLSKGTKKEILENINNLDKDEMIKLIKELSN